ncbi:MAG: amylo-alpha-1,6-glucosidase [Burkholderiales bacterium]
MLASSARADDRPRVLKHADTFALFDRHGDVRRGSEQGLFHQGTRHLSRAELRIDGRRPLLLNSSVREDNSLLAVDLTNPDFTSDHKLIIARGALHLFRGKTIWRGTCHEHLRLTNYDASAVAVTLSFEFEADFADIFEVRGWARVRRGRALAVEKSERRIVLGYEGLDQIVRRSVIDFSRDPDTIDGASASFAFSLPPGSHAELFVDIVCEEEAKPRFRYGDALSAHEKSARDMLERGCGLHTSNERFNAWLSRSRADLHMLVSETESGPYPYAGVPWFSTAFGRDGIIAALEYLWVDPGLAKGVLTFLAANQAKSENAAQDSQPGKILHETRKGELVNLNEIPFGCYYGSVDATPLFVMLAGAYFEQTHDRELIERLWPNIKLALKWIHEYGDADRDGFVEYSRASERGLAQQGWKDSEDSVFHADGAAAAGPIALAEVQGYVYQAQLAGARLAKDLNEIDFAEELNARAMALKDAFNHAFWSDEIGTFALALDGEKRRCCVATSNAGHALLCGIAEEDFARHAAKTLMNEAAFSGWGIRTVSQNQANYNPMAYHNGSVWPHDNALVAMGLARYGFKTSVEKILTAMFEASTFIELNRLPELICGFSRRTGEGPTLYPVACSPQAWSAAAVFYLLQACLGLSVTSKSVAFRLPTLPPFLDWLTIKNLRAGDSYMDLLLRRHDEDVTVNVLRRRGDASITVYR